LYLTSQTDRLFEAKPQLWAEEAYLDKPFSWDGLREAVALLLFGRTPSDAKMIDEERVRHDFKNQLAIIRGFAEILVAEAFERGDPRRRDLKEIHKASVTALALLDRLYPCDPLQSADGTPGAGVLNGYGSFESVRTTVASTGGNHNPCAADTYRRSPNCRRPQGLTGMSV
jgi:hypothetical protein